MLGSRFLALALACCALTWATPIVSARDDNIAITSLEKSVNATNGSANAAAAGTLSPFGSIGIGCGINWKTDASYGGGLQAGSSDFGLGSGFTVTPQAITIGAGIGLQANASANIQFTGAKNGSVELVFESSAPFACTPGFRDGKSVVSCRTL